MEALRKDSFLPPTDEHQQHITEREEQFKQLDINDAAQPRSLPEPSHQANHSTPEHNDLGDNNMASNQVIQADTDPSEGVSHVRDFEAERLQRFQLLKDLLLHSNALQDIGSDSSLSRVVPPNPRVSQLNETATKAKAAAPQEEAENNLQPTTPATNTTNNLRRSRRTTFVPYSGTLIVDMIQRPIWNVEDWPRIPTLRRIEMYHRAFSLTICISADEMSPIFRIGPSVSIFFSAAQKACFERGAKRMVQSALVRGIPGVMEVMERLPALAHLVHDWTDSGGGEIDVGWYPSGRQMEKHWEECGRCGWCGHFDERDRLAESR